jgi:hypothetical protein
MTRHIALGLGAAVALAASLAGHPSAQRSPADAAFQPFWAAASPQAAAGLVDGIVRAGVSFDDAYRRLQRGRTYGAQKTGAVQLRNTTADGVEHFYALNVPDAYDPARRYQARIQLHGGVGGRRTNAPVGTGTVGALTGAEQIYIIPYAWADAPWWSNDQVLNLAAIVDAAKRLYNIDENRVVVSGVSDGGTGAYWVAMRETTPFASFLPLNGFWMVLGMQDIDDGRIFPNNLRNKPLFVVNGGRDPLYPASQIAPDIERMKKAGVSVDYHPQSEAGHNTAWWPEVKDTFEAFVHDHPRVALPDTLTWETADTAANNRAHWLVIDKLGSPRAADGQEMSADLNDIAVDPAADFGTRSIGTHIVRVMPGSNAERIGLKPLDILVRVNDESVPTSVDVSDALGELKTGSHIELLVARENLPVELSGTYEPQILPSPPRHLFSRSGPTGRVDLTRSGNTVQATTRGVAAFTLLLSPDQFDFRKPVKVVANGRMMFDGKVDKNLRTLLKYAAADNDRTMLFAAELHIDLTKE